jgi:hypothetical protein
MNYFLWKKGCSEGIKTSLKSETGILKRVRKKLLVVVVRKEAYSNKGMSQDFKSLRILQLILLLR